MAWKRGQRDGLRRKRLRIIVARGAKPVQKGSGLSEKALMKPVLFFWRKMRMMNASSEVAMTLGEHGVSMAFFGSGGEDLLVRMKHDEPSYSLRINQALTINLEYI